MCTLYHTIKVSIQRYRCLAFFHKILGAILLTSLKKLSETGVNKRGRLLRYYLLTILNKASANYTGIIYSTCGLLPYRSVVYVQNMLIMYTGYPLTRKVWEFEYVWKVREFECVWKVREF